MCDANPGMDVPLTKPLIGSLRYFPTATAQCAVCKKYDPDETDGIAVRMAITLTNQILVTVMCGYCAGEEIEGLKERKEMMPSADGTMLVSTMIAEQLQEAVIAKGRSMMTASGGAVIASTDEVTAPDVPQPKVTRGSARYRGWTRRKRPPK